MAEKKTDKDRAKQIRQSNATRIENLLPGGWANRFDDGVTILDNKTPMRVFREIIAWRYTCDKPPSTNRDLREVASERLQLEPTYHPIDSGRRRIVFYLAVEDAEALVYMHHEEGTSIEVPEQTSPEQLTALLTELHERLVQGSIPLPEDE